MREFVVSERDQGQKCVKYICRILPNAGTSFVYKMLRKKNITLNGKKTDGTECLKPGDTIRIFFCGRNISEIFRYRYTGRKEAGTHAGACTAKRTYSV